jgi:hypothetical protein
LFVKSSFHEFEVVVRHSCNIAAKKVKEKVVGGSVSNKKRKEERPRAQSGRK